MTTTDLFHHLEDLRVYRFTLTNCLIQLDYTASGALYVYMVIDRREGLATCYEAF